MPLNLTHLSAFHAVATDLNFSRAAARIMVSQPALSKQVKELERHLKINLFTRSPRGVRLTQAGHILADHARRLFSLRDDAENAILALRGLHRGHLSIAATTTIAIYLLPDLLVSFRRRHPHITVQVEILPSTQIHPRLLDHSLDIGL